MSTSPDDPPHRKRLMDRTTPTTPTAPTVGAPDTRKQSLPSTDQHGNRAFVAGCLVAAVAAAVGGVVLLTGGGKPDAAPTTPPAPVTSSPTPAPTVSVPPTPNDLASTAAKAEFLEYLRVNDQVAQGGYKNLKLYDAVAVSPERTSLAAAARRLAGIRSTGNTQVATLGVQSVKLSSDPKKAFSEVGLTGCLDVTKVKAFNADGSSAITATRLPRIAFTARLQMVPAASFNEPGRRGGWYVSDVEYPGGGTAC